MPELGIVVTQYRPDAAALRRTLASLAMQDTREFEVVLADDGSPAPLLAESTAYLAAHGIAAQCAASEKNNGTVHNVLNGVQRCAGRWVFTLSPGDYLYDAGTVRWMLGVLRRDAPKVAFGRQACYAEVGGQPVQRPGDTPFDRTPYAPGRFDARAARRNLLLFDDGISGSALFYEKGLFLGALQKMDGRVKFAEDFSVRLFAAQGVPIAGYDRPVAWYEVGTGLSTDKTAASEARMLADWKAMTDLIAAECPHCREARLAQLYYHNDERRSRLARGLIGRLIVPQSHPFKRAQKTWQPPVVGDAKHLLAVYTAAEQE